MKFHLYSRKDVGMPLGKRTIHFVAMGVPLSFWYAEHNGVKMTTVYFWDEPSRCWIWSNQQWDVTPVPIADLMRIAESVLQPEPSPISIYEQSPNMFLRPSNG